MRWQRIWAISLLVALALPCVAEDWQYTVRPGDKIWNIASKYCGSSSFAKRIIQFNGLSDERSIRPGSRLRIPIEWLVRQPTSAEILNVRGHALLLTPDPEPARVGMKIEMGNHLVTQDGTVVVGFADDSSLIVGPESELLFNVLTAYGDTGMVDTNLRFYRGRGTSRIIRRNDASRFRISSPAGTAAVRGTEFRIAIDHEKTLTETLEGEVGFIQQAETSVPAGFGISASESSVSVEALLPAPKWISTPGLYAPGSVVRWKEVSGAVNYRVSVYLIVDLDTPVQQSVVGSPSYTLEGLQTTDYQVAVRGISASKLEGYDAMLTTAFGSLPPAATANTLFTEEDVNLSWSNTATSAPYSIQIAEDVTFSNEVIDAVANSTNYAPVLGAGHYYWRVKDATSIYSQAMEITVRPPAPAQPTIKIKDLSIDLEWMMADADGYHLQISRDRGFKKMVVDEQLDRPGFRGMLPDYGAYFVRIVAVTNGIESQPTMTETRLLRKTSWWWLGILAVPFLL